MKALTIVIIFFQISILNAQKGGQHRGQGQRQNNMQGVQKMLPYSAEKASGIINYDESKIIKKIKIIDENKKREISIAIYNYNKIIDEIRFVNSLKFKEIDVIIAAERKKTMVTRDRDGMGKTQVYVKNLLEPIKIEVRETKMSFNQKIKKILSEKQYKKWLKYQSKEEKKLKPKQTKSQNNNQNIQKGTKRKGKGQMNSF